MNLNAFRRLQSLDGIIPPGPSFNRRDARWRECMQKICSKQTLPLEYPQSISIWRSIAQSASVVVLRPPRRPGKER